MAKKITPNPQTDLHASCCPCFENEKLFSTRQSLTELHKNEQIPVLNEGLSAGSYLALSAVL